ncbi:unnamed protein product [Rhodiola kirilowii]
MPQLSIPAVELFDVCGINFLGSFSPSWKSIFLVVVDYVSKWVEAVANPTCDAKVVRRLYLLGSEFSERLLVMEAPTSKKENLRPC